MFRTHWWPRPQWEGVRRRLAWYVVPSDGRAEATAWQHRLAADHLDPVPAGWLHVTIETLAVDADALDRATIDAIAASARAGLATAVPFEATCARLEVWEEGIVWLVEPAGAFGGLRTRLLAATADHLPLGDPRPFVPHLSLAYANATAADHGARAAVAQAGPGPRFAVRDVVLIALGREERVYVWDELARVPLGG